MKDDDRADLLWHPEHASNASSQGVTNCALHSSCHYIKFLLY